MHPLTQRAVTLGATAAVLVAADRIPVDEGLAANCSAGGCGNYGRAMSCPPAVAGPEGFRETLRGYAWAVLFRLEVPADTLLSRDGRAAFGLLNRVATDLERAAIAEGFPRARAYTGGSCKEAFCHEHERCRVLAAEGECRHPLWARESLSGFGVDVGELVQSVGWTMEWVAPEQGATQGTLANLYGLVLLG